tara:strand:- start:83 stop:217 length:135 start_codon:yes stop_codon:yes gene_type:complete
LVAVAVAVTEQPLEEEDGEVAVVPTIIDLVVLVVQVHGVILDLK